MPNMEVVGWDTTRIIRGGLRIFPRLLLFPIYGWWQIVSCGVERRSISAKFWIAFLEETFEASKDDTIGLL